MNAHTTILAHPTMLRDVPPIALLRALPPGPLAKEHGRLKRLAELFAPLSREDMEAGVELLLAEMDALDGDPDNETGQAEDEPLTGPMMEEWKPGCEIADPDICIEHNGGSGLTGDRTYAEWDTLPTNRRRTGAIDGMQLPTSALYANEDDEDDDAAEAVGDEQDGVGAADDFMQHAEDRYGLPGCPISDPVDATLAECVTQPDCPRGYSSDDEEPWHQSPTMDGPVPANDRVSV